MTTATQDGTEDVVKRARETAIYVRGIAAGLQDIELAGAETLLTKLCDEVEAWRECFPVPSFCSCGGAYDVREYVEHRRMGHDGGLETK